jgi:hypothetical protein
MDRAGLLLSSHGLLRGPYQAQKHLFLGKTPRQLTRSCSKCTGNRQLVSDVFTSLFVKMLGLLTFPVIQIWVFMHGFV